MNSAGVKDKNKNDIDIDNNGGLRIICDTHKDAVVNADDDDNSSSDDDSEVDSYHNNRVGTRSGVNRRNDDYSTDDGN